MVGELSPKHPNVPFDLVNTLLARRDISKMIDVVYRHRGQKETVIFCDQTVALGFRQAFQCRYFLRHGRHGHPGRKVRSLSTRPGAAATEYEQQYIDGLITQGEKYNKVVDAWAKANDTRRRCVMMATISAVKVDR